MAETGGPDRLKERARKELEQMKMLEIDPGVDLDDVTEVAALITSRVARSEIGFLLMRLSRLNRDHIDSHRLYVLIEDASQLFGIQELTPHSFSTRG
ncbi:hypothetical protein SEA_ONEIAGILLIAN_91 [Microbacterium phage OneinaGillian]|uniref:Uncharacterized protein n=1 Tax=Microbacterium phage OneinaGillian TaxID=2301604 RepID=A0A385UF27_9CAUD|nr:hypothetical protein HOU23_gp091 [Microbacterium phage OneinaGillian]AYB70201.1 hypothetical protein SEA_ONEIAGILLIAN_91 [Microbacterium phage OneinaGillian]